MNNMGTGPEQGGLQFAKACRKAGMKYEDYQKGGGKMTAADYDGMEEEDADKAAKAQVTVDDLVKSIDAYDALETATGDDSDGREAYLNARMIAGTLSKGERQEYGRLLAGDKAEAPLRKSLTDQLDEDTTELVDASDFLKSLVGGVEQTLEATTEEVLSSNRATRELLKSQGSMLKGMARLVVSQNEVIKSLGARLATVESKPRDRRSQRSYAQQGRPLAKSAANNDDGDQLTKAQIGQGLDILVRKAAEADDDIAMKRITHATALFETSGAVNPNIQAAIRQVLAA